MNVLRRWTLSTMRLTRRDGSDYTLIVADGPALQGTEQPEVVPADQLAGAVDRALVDAALIAWDVFRGDNNLDGMIGFEEACEALNALRGQ